MLHKKNIMVEKVDDFYIASDNTIGSISIFSPVELTLLNCYKILGRVDYKEFLRVTECLSTRDKDRAAAIVNNFIDKIYRDGWTTKDIQEYQKKMELVYFSITKNCNFKCNYCYQQSGHCADTNIGFANFEKALQVIKSVNRGCHVVLNGGEPFLHTDFGSILDIMDNSGLRYSILTNGSLINDMILQKISHLKNLKKIQISLDGYTPETHALTRGNTFNSVMSGIKKIIRYGLPFSIAPTVHDKNIDEIYDIALYTYKNGGSLSLNNLRQVSQKNPEDIVLSPENLNVSLSHVFRALQDSNTIIKSDEDTENYEFSTKKYSCGAGMQVFSIDWNCDVYPCHMLDLPNLKLGNIMFTTIEDLIAKSIGLGVRSKSIDIEECSNCHFAFSCAGGCKADAYFNNGSFLSPDSLCGTLRKFNLQNFYKARTGLDVKDPCLTPGKIQ